MTELRVYENLGKNSLRFLFFLLQKHIIPNELRALVVVSNKDLAAALNDQLWTGMKMSFLPHCLANDENAAKTPIVIGAPDSIPDAPPIRDVLITLGDVHSEGAASYQNYVALLPARLEDNGKLSALVEDLRGKGHECKVFDQSKKAGKD